MHPTPLQPAPNHRMIRPEEGTALLFFTIIAFIGVQFLVSAIIVPLQNTLEGHMGLVMMVLNNAIHIMFIAMYLLLVVRRKRYFIWDFKHRAHNGTRPTTNQNLALYAIIIAIGILSLPAFFFATNLYAGLFSLITGYESNSFLLGSPAEVVLAIIVIVGLAPFSEEFIFRGALLSGLRRQMSAFRAVMLSSLAFMLFHMSPSQVFYQFILGVIMGFAVVYSGKFVAAIIIHFISNAMAMTLSLIATSSKSFNHYYMQFFENNPALILVFTFIAPIVLGGAIVALMYLMHRIKPKDGKLPPLKEPVFKPKGAPDMLAAIMPYGMPPQSAMHIRYHGQGMHPHNIHMPPPPHGMHGYPHHPPQSMGINPFFIGQQNPYPPPPVQLDPFESLDPFEEGNEASGNLQTDTTNHAPHSTHNPQFNPSAPNAQQHQYPYGLPQSFYPSAHAIYSRPQLEEPLADIPAPEGMEIDHSLTNIRHEKRKRGAMRFFWISLGICSVMWLISFLLGAC